MMKGLERLRVKAKLTQKEAAERIGVDRTTIVKWETEAGNPRIDMLPKLAEMYGCTIGSMFGEENSAEPPEQKKKIRIVIEYDPETEKWSMNVDH